MVWKETVFIIFFVRSLLLLIAVHSTDAHTTYDEDAHKDKQTATASYDEFKFKPS